MYEDFIVHYEGFITSPVTGNVRFWPQADDGTKLYINDLLVQNDWRDKGGGGAISSIIPFEEGVSKKFEMWFYENGGGAWTTLYWDIGNGWEVVPDSAFTTEYVPRTLPPYLNAPSNVQITSITDSSVSLSWDVPEQSNVDVERYAIMWSCENNWDASWAISSYTNEATINGLESATSCIFQVRADNDTIAAYSNWSQSVTGVTETTTTTTTTTTSTTTTTVPETTTTTEATTTTTVPKTTTTVLETTTTTTTTTVPETTTTTTLAPKGIDKEVSALIENTENLSKEEIVAAVENIIADGVSSEEAIAISANADVLNAISTDEAKEIFQEIVVSELSEEQESALVEAMTDAPADVKEAFEEEIDIFGEGLDDYVATGSQIDVKSRRALIAVTTAITTITTAPMPSGGAPSAPSGNPSGGGEPSGDGGSSEDRKTRRSRRK
jgi:uncharacterized protein YoaH (UPF0181 family)